VVNGSATMPSTERFVWVGFGLVLVAVIASGIWTLWRAPRGAGPEDLPVLGTVPDFSLIERSGRPVRLADLRGRPWVANFVFTNCAGVCPLLSTHMANLREALGANKLPVRSVSFTVDPTRDTPAVLRAYADRYHADPDGWLFLTGDHDAVYRLIGEGFLLSVAERAPDGTLAPGDLVTHSDRFVLVDGDGRIRAYYRGTDADLIPHLLSDIRKLGGSP